MLPVNSGLKDVVELCKPDVRRNPARDWNVVRDQLLLIGVGRQRTFISNRMGAASGCWGAAAGIVQRSDLTLHGLRSAAPLLSGFCWATSRLVPVHDLPPETLVIRLSNRGS
jgi:hypothetical protein